MARILVVDDDECVRAALEATLTRAGYEVECAANGFDALERHEAGPFDLVITDIVMPEMEGIETIRVLKRLSPNMPVIAVSGGARLDPRYHLKIAAALGADVTLAKPVYPSDLRAAVERQLAASSPDAAPRGSRSGSVTKEAHPPPGARIAG